MLMGFPQCGQIIAASSIGSVVSMVTTVSQYRLSVPRVRHHHPDIRVTSRTLGNPHVHRPPRMATLQTNMRVFRTGRHSRLTSVMFRSATITGRKSGSIDRSASIR